MNKKFLLFLVVVLIATTYFFSFEKIVYRELLALRTSVQNSYLNGFVYVSEVLSKYFTQLSYINELQKENKENNSYKILYEERSKQLLELQKNLEIKVELPQKYHLVDVISYVALNDFSKVILEYSPTSIQEPPFSALVTYDGYSAGVASHQNGQTIGFLNENPKCNYTVFIGEQKNPGITSGVNHKGELVIKYVPIWKEVTIGDEVITSGMDDIFPFGIKVGQVTGFEISDNMQQVFIKPYANSLSYKEFFIYEKESVQTTSIEPVKNPLSPK